MTGAVKQPSVSIRAMVSYMAERRATASDVAVLVVPEHVVFALGLGRVLSEAREHAHQFGFRDVRVVRSGTPSPIPAKAAHRRRYSR